MTKDEDLSFDSLRDITSTVDVSFHSEPGPEPALETGPPFSPCKPSSGHFFIVWLE